MFLFKRRKPGFMERFLKKSRKFDPFEIKGYEAALDYITANKTPVTPKSLGLKLVVVADTHGYLAFGENRFAEFMDTVGDYDLCVLLGDHHAKDLKQILDCIPTEKIIAVKGNHDSFSLYSEHGIKDISGSSYIYRGVRFAGIDGSFKYKNEAFPSYTQHQSLALGDRLPAADVLLTHDVALTDFNKDTAHLGLIGITHYVYKNGVQWHIHGHIHHSYEKRYDNGTTEKSVYLCEVVKL